MPVPIIGSSSAQRVDILPVVRRPRVKMAGLDALGRLRGTTL